ncbi:MAG: ribosome maturation factor RimM [Actinomycetota bacterium]
MGEIATAHGLKGEVSVKIFSDNEARFAPGSALLVGADPNSAKSLIVQSFNSHHGRAYLKFKEVNDRSSAEALRRMDVFGNLDDLPELGPDTYWMHDLIGLGVEDLEGKVLGTLSEIEERGEQDLWTVDTAGGQVLLPAAKQIIVSVDLDARLIIVDPPAGLFPAQDPSEGAGR